jgi:hypothetical protein
METQMKKFNPTTIEWLVVRYHSSLASYLDEKGIKWSSTSSSDFICIYFPRPMTPSSLFEFGIMFAEWRESVTNY